MSHQLTTERLTLRSLVQDDARSITALIGDFEVTRWLTRAPYPYAKDDAQVFVERHLNTQDTLAITADHLLMGIVSNHEELGYWVGKPFWGNGFATEAAQAVVDAHFEGGQHCLVSGHLLKNAASRAVLIKLGFVDTNIEERPSASLGENVEIQRMQLTAADWQARQ